MGVTKPRSDFSNLNWPKCGIRTSLNFRITFGETAGEGQFPWVASLMYRNRRGVSTQHVVTAGHCDASQGGFSLASIILGRQGYQAPTVQEEHCGRDGHCCYQTCE